MLIRTSAPQPATMTTPTGGTGYGLAEVPFETFSGLRGRLLTEEGDEDEEDDTGSAGHVCDGLVGWCKWCMRIWNRFDRDLEIGFEFVDALSVQA